MALIKCPECGRERVSENAEMCPDCGYGMVVFTVNIAYNTIKNGGVEMH